MELNPIQAAIQKRQEAGLRITNLSFADFTFYDTLLSKGKIQNAFASIFKYPYYYPAAKGELEARQAVVEYYNRQDQEIDPESLILTSSINQSYLYLFKLFSSAGGKILIPSPNTPALQEVAGFLGLELQTYPLLADQNWQIDLTSLEKLITPKTKAIFLMSPHLPTGAIQKEETLRRLAKLIKGKNIALIVDESLSDFIFKKQKLPLISVLMRADQLVISLQTLSNSFALPGLKLSWIQVSGPANQAKPLLQNLEFLADTFLTINQVSQAILPDVIRYSNHWRKRFQAVVEKNCRTVVKRLGKSPHLRFHHPEGGFYAFIEILDATGQPITQPKADLNFALQLLNQTGIYVHPGYYYGQKTGCYIMLCFLQDPKILRISCKKLLKFLNNHFNPSKTQT
jgi:aspartate/methionine/tyrosine aminotransferase